MMHCSCVTPLSCMPELELKLDLGHASVAFPAFGQPLLELVS